MWFEKLTGFKEESPDQVRKNLKVEDGILTSLVNGQSYHCGQLEIPNLAALRELHPDVETGSVPIKLSEVVANVQDLHLDPENEGALFQAASQFNLLEMVSPEVTPEQGVGIYEHDRTQGPACAIACGAGTIYRNYFVPVDGQIGQSTDHQIDCLQDIGIALDNPEHQYWTMKNGYALANLKGIRYIDDYLPGLTPAEYESMKGKLRIGLQWDTEVTLQADSQLVSQIYCSALPVAYTQIHIDLWERFARLVLDATYEATFYAALTNRERTGNNRLFLTLVGGGVFGNSASWIIASIQQMINKFEGTGLDIRIVSYGKPDPRVRELLDRL